MKPTIPALFAEASAEEIISTLETALKEADEAPFWAEKTLPFCRAILSALIPLRSQNLLFTPEGRPQTELTPELFLRWCDLVSLKMLAFTLQQSNNAGKLERTSYDEENSARYAPIDLETLGSYLSGYGVNLEEENEDFPIAHYNLHTGITGVIKNLL